MRRALAVLFALAALAAASAPQQAAAACANEDRRIEQGAGALSLPDCRAYELVSPGHALGQDERVAKVALSGDRISYYTTRPSSTAASSSYYHLAVRGPQGWTVQSAAPQTRPAAVFDGRCEQNVFFSPDLTRNIDEEGWSEPEEPAHCKRNGEVLVPGEQSLHRNVFLHDVASGSNRLVNLAPPGADPANAKFQDASDDFSRIVFSSEAELTADAPAGYNFYVWSDGTVSLLTRGPDGAPVSGELAEAAGHQKEDGTVVNGSGMAPATGAFAADGGWAFFYAGGALYGRSNPAEPQSAVSAGQCTEPALACTVQIDSSQGPGTSGGGIFWRADPSGRKVLFTAESALTPDSTATPGAADLYLYDTETGQLEDLTVNPGESADVRGVVAAAQDASYVYFVANGVLAPGATPGNCKGAAVVGQQQLCNLYLHQGGTTTFIASLSRMDGAAWQESVPAGPDPRRKRRGVTANASPDGRFLVFASAEQLTGYDNRNVNSDFPEEQIFLYDAAADGGAGRLDCASCRPDGERPSGSVRVYFDGNYGPGAPGGNASWRIDVVLEDGSVYFDSPEQLVGADTNGVRDVYRYRDGEHRLISTGSHPAPVRLMGVSPSGNDVFFRTAAPLLGADVDGENASLYDARVGGGFPQPSPPPPPCAGEGCRPFGEGLPAVPLPATASSTAAGKKPRQGRRRCRGVKQRKAKRRCQRAKHRGSGKSRNASGGRR